ncbi:MAG: hypothetical protein M3014_10225 [Chloroflexota bacterium]|nr:hypothetical protein [Chloroflexota bacterium]
MRDIIGAPPEEVAAERARVATEGWGAQLLSMQGADGSWGGTAFNQGWDSTMHVLTLLRELGLDRTSEQVHHAVGLVRDHVRWMGWDWDGTWRGEGFVGNPFFAGEVEPCINGQVAASGAYFGLIPDIQRIIDLLLNEQLPDGGWNCEAERGSTRSSFNTTICVLEALLEYELADASHGGRAESSGNRESERGAEAITMVREARMRGQEYLIERRLLRRLSSGEVIDPAFTRFSFPTWWHYDVLRGLEYLRRAGVTPDERVASLCCEAIELVKSKRDRDGRWPLENQHPGTMPLELDRGEGMPSRWNTLRALRVLDWFSARG